MRQFEEFKRFYYEGFKLSNHLENLSFFEEELKLQNITILQNGENFFFYDRHNFLYYFVREVRDFKLQKSFVKILGKNPTYLTQNEEFLKLNGFNILIKHAQMQLLSPTFTPQNYSFIEEAKNEDIVELREFFSQFFDTTYLFLFSLKELEDKLHQCLIYKEKGRICGGLLYTNILNGLYIDFIAVRENLAHKNVAFALLNTLIKRHPKTQLKLFVDKLNQKAVRFYEKAGFSYTKNEFNFYFKE
ncbi:GNAT family N-acetyltransferase [Campylobacter vulpis]|uniref:GNAT family N-acetyltransferase n=1 Tax=Campylobacter vulpis TaxID=1655500 RepID=UPI001BCAB289|nr:GNAT family N-acetyltransferase [Campylobacter vulpis]MBS4236099.1 GNAT family N-acetyltransferase [Campylobacter vulpis]MBS4269671.1 GNAT family N-acetyltransferase [Campylobacter vulpis]